MTSGSLDGGEYGDYNGVGSVAITKLFAMQDSIFFGTEAFGRIWKAQRNQSGLPAPAPTIFTTY